MLHIHTYPQTRGIRVVWACHELGIQYDYHVVNLYTGEHKSEAFARLSPTRKVPVIVDDELKEPSGKSLTMAESGAIVSYLADKVGKLIPTVGSAERAHFEEVMCFVMTELEQPLWTKAKHKFALPEEKRIPAAATLADWEFDNALKIFSEMLGDKDYVLGSEFSVADIIAGHVLSWAQGSDQTIAFENVRDYATRVLTRPALKAARQKEKEVKASLTA